MVGRVLNIGGVVYWIGVICKGGVWMFGGLVAWQFASGTGRLGGEACLRYLQHFSMRIVCITFFNGLGAVYGMNARRTKSRTHKTTFHP